MTKKIAILGGGTNTYISNHLALSAPAYNTTTNMKEYVLNDGSRIHAVHLDHHGPNIMFSSKTSPNFINEFINEHWNIDKQTTGVLEDSK